MWQPRTPYTRLTPGDAGVVRFVDDLGTVHVDWEPDGHTLGLVPGVDVGRELHQRWWDAPMGESKFCPHCKQQRPIDDFALRNQGRASRQSWCRTCIAEANRTRRKEADRD